MAIVHKLYDGTNTIDFTATTGFYHLYPYQPQIAIPPGDGSIPPYVIEVVPVRITGTSDDNFAAELQTFHLLQKEAQEYWLDQKEETAVWYHQQLTGETGERRALVKSLALVPADDTSNWFSPAPATTEGKLYKVVIERHPYWESTTAVTTATNTPAAGASVLYDYTASPAADIVGDVGARIARLNIDATSADAIDRCWIGIKSTRYGVTPGSFTNIWEAEDGSNSTGDATDTVDATASGGDRVTVAESALDWDSSTNGGIFQEVMYLSLSAAGGASANEYGTNLWLLRAKVTAGTWEIQARFGYLTMATSEAVVKDVVEISSTSWDYHELGIVPHPPRNLQAITTSILNAGHDDAAYVMIHARRTSGAGDLHLDCFCPIPLDDGFLYLSKMSHSHADHETIYGASPKDEEYAITWQNGVAAIRQFLPIISHSFRYPPGDGRLVIVYARESSSDITDQITITGVASYFPRWVSLRGAE